MTTHTTTTAFWHPFADMASVSQQELLIERGKLDSAALERALRLQQESGDKLGALLVTLGLVAQRDVAECLAQQLELPMVDAAGYPEFPILEERVADGVQPLAGPV